MLVLHTFPIHHIHMYAAEFCTRGESHVSSCHLVCLAPNEAHRVLVLQEIARQLADTGNVDITGIVNNFKQMKQESELQSAPLSPTPSVPKPTGDLPCPPP